MSLSAKAIQQITYGLASFSNIVMVSAGTHKATIKANTLDAVLFHGFRFHSSLGGRGTVPLKSQVMPCLDRRPDSMELQRLLHQTVTHQSKARERFRFVGVSLAGLMILSPRVQVANI